MDSTREEMSLDVLYVGGGPANMAGAIHLMRLAKEKGMDIEVGLIEKGDEIGAHSLSGAILDPIALAELIPDYGSRECPIEFSQCQDTFYFLTATRQYKVPFVPKFLHNDGCHIISLSKFTRWLGDIAENEGVNIFPGFAGTDVLYDTDSGSVKGVGTGDKGVDAEGKQKPNFEPGIDLTARVTVFGEGSKGSLIRKIGRKKNIFPHEAPQTFETAIKEVIELPKENRVLESETTVIHTFGYPLGMNTKGGAFLYRMTGNRISLGLVIGLDYEAPMLEPYSAFIQLKKHPLIAEIIAGGKVLQQGAKTLNTGGFYTMPTVAIGGALFVGDSASMLNAQRLKGIHTAMKSGMLAAETIIDAFEKDDFSNHSLSGYRTRIEKSWIHEEQYRSRNFSQALSKKGPAKWLHLGAQFFSNGTGAVDPMATHADHSAMKPVGSVPPDWPDESDRKEGDAFDGNLYVDKLTGVFLSGTTHIEDQPCHLIVQDLDLCRTRCFREYRNPCTRFCPAQVYEIVADESGNRKLKLNPSNCLHCKTCEIKDPYQNITWNCPEGGGGPKYTIT